MALSTLCAGALVFALGFFAFHWATEELIVQPLKSIGDWIGTIEVEDHGGDYRITPPPIEGEVK